jgi:hypothetical protein
MIRAPCAMLTIVRPVARGGHGTVIAAFRESGSWSGIGDSLRQASRSGISTDRFRTARKHDREATAPKRLLTLVIVAIVAIDLILLIAAGAPGRALSYHFSTDWPWLWACQFSPLV